MSTMKSTLAATFLTLVLTVPAFPGSIETPGGIQPPPPPPRTVESGDNPTPYSPAPGDPELSSMLVDILLAVLRMF